MKYLETFFSGLNFSPVDTGLVEDMMKRNLKELAKHLKGTGEILWSKNERSNPADQVTYLGFGLNNLVYEIMENNIYVSETQKNEKHYFIKKHYYSDQGDPLYKEFIDGNLNSAGGPLIYRSLSSAKQRCGRDYKNVLDKSQLEWMFDFCIVAGGKELLGQDVILKEVSRKDDEYTFVQCALGKKAFYIICQSDKLQSVDNSYYVEKLNLDGSFQHSLNSHLVNYKSAVRLAQKDYGKDLNLEKTR